MFPTLRSIVDPTALAALAAREYGLEVTGCVLLRSLVNDVYRLDTEDGPRALKLYRAGYEPATRLLTEATCWQLADSVVRTYDGDMTDVSAAPSTVVDAVLHLAGDLAEHLRTPDDVAAWTGLFYSDVQAIPGARIPAPVKKMLDRQKALDALGARLEQSGEQRGRPGQDGRPGPVHGVEQRIQ